MMQDDGVCHYTYYNFITISLWLTARTSNWLTLMAWKDGNLAKWRAHHNMKRWYEEMIREYKRYYEIWRANGFEMFWVTTSCRWSLVSQRIPWGWHAQRPCCVRSYWFGHGQMAREETSTGFPISGGEEILEMGRSTVVCTTVNGFKMLW